jgi:O-antigen/teichoic acid export membrane protein
VYAFVMSAANVALSLLLIPHFGALGAAVATAVSYAVVQIAYVADQQRRLQTGGAGVYTLWATVSLLGAVQAFIGNQLQWRIVWAAASIAIVAWAAKRFDIVSARLIEKLFSGALSPLGALLRRAVTA